MGVLTDLAKEVKEYPDSEVSIKIHISDIPGTDINQLDVVKFWVSVNNNGLLGMQNVVLHVVSTEYTEVSQTDVLGTPSNFSSNIKCAPMNIRPGELGMTRYLYMRALKKTSRTKLMDVHLHSWDADLHPLLQDESDHSVSTNAEYENQIKGQE